MKRFRIILFAVLATVISSCSITSKSSFAPDCAQLNLSLDDMEYLGDVNVSVDYDRYIGIFKKVHKINDVDYDGKKIDRVKASIFKGGVAVDPMICYALPKVYEMYPDADYMVFVCESSHREILFLGSEISVSARLKVYKFKK
ncbi:MAG: hypothetical protein ACI39U_03500 [Candidatus Cryptobacteroides sp.]